MLYAGRWYNFPLATGATPSEGDGGHGWRVDNLKIACAIYLKTQQAAYQVSFRNLRFPIEQRPPAALHIWRLDNLKIACAIFLTVSNWTTAASGLTQERPVALLQETALFINYKRRIASIVRSSDCSSSWICS